MDGFGRLIRRLMAMIRPREEKPRESEMPPEDFDRHWGEWWPFVAEFRDDERDE